MGLLMVAVHFGALAFWPVYRLRSRGRPRLRSLSVAFVIYLTLVFAWTAIMVATGIRHRDHAWLAWLTIIYIALNVAFAFVYVVLWFRGSGEFAEAPRSR